MPGEPIPKELEWLVDRCAQEAEIASKEIIHCLISKYPPDSTIGWHTDKMLFGSKVMGLSLQSNCQMRFQRNIKEQRFVYEITLDPRSLYILSGEVRYKWQHSIPPTHDLRYSITFRTLKK